MFPYNQQTIQNIIIKIILKHTFYEYTFSSWRLIKIMFKRPNLLIDIIYNLHKIIVILYY